MREWQLRRRSRRSESVGPTHQSHGKFYGTTSSGGGNGNNGTVFEWHRRGHDQVLQRFKGRADGKDPEAGLAAVNGVLYGTTFGDGRRGFGTVFSVLPTGSKKVLHLFTDGADGANPSADLIADGSTRFSER